MFTCQNEHLSISGGVAIVPPKFPIKKAAEQSAEAEKAAKSYNMNEKNAISFLGFAMGWEKEFPVVKEIKDELVGLLESQKLPKSFISKLNSHFTLTQADNIDDGKFTIPPRLYWIMAYDFGRLNSRLKDTAAKEFINQCNKDIISNRIKGKDIATDQYHALQLWHIASRWAELEYRTLL